METRSSRIWVTAPVSSPQSPSESSPQTRPCSCPPFSPPRESAHSPCPPQLPYLPPPAKTAPSATHARESWHSSFRCAHPLPRARQSLSVAPQPCSHTPHAAR